MSLKSLSLNFEQLENKTALSTLSTAVHHGKTNNIVKHSTNIVKHPIYHRTKIDPIHVPTVPSPINSTPPTILSPINSTPSQAVPFKFVQNIMPDGSIRCQPVNNAPNTVLNQNSPNTVLNQNSEQLGANDNNVKQTNNGRSSLPLFVMSVTPSGAIHCVATPGKVMLID
jgi:hypothetical protein